MTAAVIDTLRFADRLKESGIQARHAEGIARALGEELADRLVTKSDLDEALSPLRDGILALEARFDGLDPRFEAIDTKFEAIDTKFEAIDTKFDATKFDAIDAKFDAIDAKFDAMDAKFDAMDAKFDAIDTKFDAKFDAMDAKFEALHREVSGKFNLLATMMALGFTLVVGLGLFNALSPRVGAPDAESTTTQREDPVGADPVNALSDSANIG